jgi:hypothetical protein
MDISQEIEFTKEMIFAEFIRRKQVYDDIAKKELKNLSDVGLDIEFQKLINKREAPEFDGHTSEDVLDWFKRN